LIYNFYGGESRGHSKLGYFWASFGLSGGLLGWNFHADLAVVRASRAIDHESTTRLDLDCRRVTLTLPDT